MDDIDIGRFRGVVAERFALPAFVDGLAKMKDLLSSPDARILSAGRNRNIRIPVKYKGRFVPVVVKAFGGQSFVKDLIAAKNGSKARRTWAAAEFLQRKNVGTPGPVAFLERWYGRRLVESYFVSEFQDGVSSFKDELALLFKDDPECWKFMALMRVVADAIRKMHLAGFQHNDLGNQNILLRRTGDGEWGDVQFIDLNRARFKDTALTPEECARDISRIYLPSDLLRVFKEMYYGDQTPPPEFLKAEAAYRARFRLHTRTRSLRHPVRSFVNRHRDRAGLLYPSEKDMWIWDERSVQPISVLRPKDRKKFYPPSRHLNLLVSSASGALPVWAEYRRLLQECYRKPVTADRGIGMSIEPVRTTWGREQDCLSGLGRLPVLIRFYAHSDNAQHRFLAGVVRNLKAAGHAVSVALVQDRRSVTNPARWDSFVSEALDLVADDVEGVEICHAINRVKWGIWSFDEYRRLLEGVQAVKARYPGLKLMGPAAIDFEYHAVLAALDNVPEGLKFHALSHHLYVDRRGAPEERQGRFSALEKFALARAIARWSGKCGDRLVISEVNWPLKGTGVYSPVNSPYISPGTRFNDPSVDEDQYADFMIRYLLIALCSGMVDRVYWWRLVARGFGLVDDTDARRWRERPAYGMLKVFLKMLEGSSYQSKLQTESGVEAFTFAGGQAGKFCVAYSTSGKKESEVPFAHSRRMTAGGEEVRNTGTLILDGRPVYLFG